MWTGGIKDATAGYKEGFKTSVLDMIHWSEGLFGFVASLQPLLNTLESFTRLSAPVGDNASAHPLPNFDGDLSIPSLQKAYRRGLSPVDVIETVFDRIKKYKEVDPAVWIHLETEASALKRARKLLCDWPDRSRLPPLVSCLFRPIIPLFIGFMWAGDLFPPSQDMSSDSRTILKEEY